MGAVKISYLSLFLYCLLLVIPIAILVYLKLKMVRSLLVSVSRMIVQLAFVGVYLGYIFKLNNPFLNALWILIMMVAANQQILRQSGLKFKIFFLYTFPSYVITIVFCFITFLIVFDIGTFFSARYLIPIGGMVMGNMLRGNIVSLDRFYHSLTRREEEYIYYISLGATRREALLPFISEALKPALSLFSHSCHYGPCVSPRHDDRSNPGRCLAGGSHSIPDDDHDCHICCLIHIYIPGNSFFHCSRHRCLRKNKKRYFYRRNQEVVCPLCPLCSLWQKS
jgi:putative ABC transport system permease protein